MDINSFNKVKGLYEDGYKCIRYEDTENGQFTAYFKNFEDERIDTIICNNKEEIREIKTFIDTY